ncbi:MAG: Tad domain-containing protein [Pirellulaceae bacterium]
MNPSKHEHPADADPRESRTVPASVARRLRGLHGDQSGAMGIFSLFALILLVTLVGMVINSAKQVDQKVKMQNAADAATYSGGVVMARGMNTLAFTNHLLCDVFALTAFMREARDRNAERMTPEILDNWDRVAPAFAGSEFPKFADLSPAAAEKAMHEREMVRTWSEWSAAASELMLPVLEEILSERQIPEFQRALVRTTPQLVQYAADEAARRHGAAWPREAEVRGVMWRTGVDLADVDPVGGISEDQRRTVPVVDPVADMVPNRERYFRAAVAQRHRLSHTYLRQWNDSSLQVFDVLGKMSRFSSFWRIFTCGQLEKLLKDDYPDDNLPFQIRHTADQIDSLNDHLEGDFMFVGVVYSDQLREAAPGVFRNPSSGDEIAYAQVMVFVPRRRLIKYYPGTGGGGGGVFSFGGVPGQVGPLPGPPVASSDPPPAPPPEPDDDEDQDDEPKWLIGRQSAAYFPDGPTQWNLLNQNWIAQLVPATTRRLPEILSATPYVNGTDDVTPPDLKALDERDLPWLSHH